MRHAKATAESSVKLDAAKQNSELERFTLYISWGPDTSVLYVKDVQSV